MSSALLVAGKLTAAGNDKRTVACLATLLGCVVLLGIAFSLHVAALQFQVQDLRGRVEALERTLEIRVNLQTVSPGEHSHVVGGSMFESLFGSAANAAKNDEVVQRSVSDGPQDGRAHSGRLKREVALASGKPIAHAPQDYLYSGDDLTLPSVTYYETSTTPSVNSASVPPLRKNKGSRKRRKHVLRSGTSYPSTTSTYSTSTETALISRPSRVMKTDTGILGSLIMPPTFRSKPIYEESRGSPLAVVRSFTKTRRRRPKHEARNGSLETLDEVPTRPTRTRHFVAGHYHGDTSDYTTAHEHYDGNGRLRHPDGIFQDWTPDSWMRTLGMNNHLSLSTNGVVTVQHSGLYFLYAQIYYVDEHDTNGFRLYVNRDAILHCTTHSSNIDHSVKANTCFTASLAYLNINDQISVTDVEGLRYSLFEPAKSFFGLFKVSDDKQR